MPAHVPLPEDRSTVNHRARPQLTLVSGRPYIFRAFFALPLQASFASLPTNALCGLTNLMLKLIKPHHHWHWSRNCGTVTEV